MNIDIKSLIMPVVVVLLAFCGWYYHGQYKQVSADLKLATETITDMQTRQRDVAALDAKYTKELADAKASNDFLRDAVDDGRKRLLVKAKCMRETPGSSSVGDGGTSELDESVRKDYYDLREMISRQNRQVLYLQDYIKNACLK